MYGYIYKTTNLVNSKIYIGLHSAKEFDYNYMGSGKLIRRAFEKYGIENFNCEMIDTGDSREELIVKEQYWIKYYNSQNKSIGYNISNGGDGIISPMPIEMREHLRQINLGKKYSDEVKQKLSEVHSGINNGFYGKHHSEKTRNHISEVLKQQYKNGRINGMTGVHRCGKDASRYGAKLSDETRKKISDSVKGFKHTDEAKRKMSNSVKGRIFMNDGIKNKRVKPNELQRYLDLGYVRGRLTPWQ